MEWNSVSDTEREETGSSASEQIDLSTAAEQSSFEDEELGGDVLAEQVAEVTPAEQEAMHVADDGGVEAGLNAALDAASGVESDEEAASDEPEVDPYEDFRNELRSL